MNIHFALDFKKSNVRTKGFLDLLDGLKIELLSTIFENILDRLTILHIQPDLPMNLFIMLFLENAYCYGPEMPENVGDVCSVSYINITLVLLLQYFFQRC